MKRIFTGVKIEASVKMIELVDSLKLELRSENIRWVNTENYHITLKFFGNTDDLRINRIIEVFDKISINHIAFNIKVANTGTFERNNMPKIVWFDTLDNEPLYKLTEDIEDNILCLGYNKETRPFRAHMTIGSIRYIRDMKRFNDIVSRYKKVILQETKIDRFILFESILKPGGPVYKEISIWKLNDDLSKIC